MALLERRDTQHDGRESAIEPTLLAIAMKAEINAASAEITKRLKRELGVAHFDETVAKVRETRSAIT